MRTTSRLLTGTIVLGGGLLLAAPASAQTATTTLCPYPFVDCPTSPTTPISGGGGGAGTDVTAGANGGAGSAGGSLPFTGGEVALIAVSGVAALAGGTVLVAAGRKRLQA